jgi:hypothetical protein
MALVTIPGGLYMPHCPQLTSAPGYGTVVLDASADRMALVFQSPVTASLTGIGFCTGTVTTGDTVDVRVETVSTTDGFPTGSLVAATTNKTQVIANADDNTWFDVTLTSAASLTKGTLYAIVIAASGSPGNLQVRYLNMAASGLTPNYPYIANNLTGSYAMLATATGNFALKFGSAYYTPGGDCYAISALNSVTFNSGSTPDERGLKFQVPFNCALDGGWTNARYSVAGVVQEIVLYDASDVVLATCSIDTDQVSSNALNRNSFFTFSSAQTITANTIYRLVHKPGASNIIVPEFDVDEAGMLDMMPGGQNWHLTTRADAGAWTDTTTSRPWMGIHLTQVDDGTSTAPVARSLIATRASTY